MNRRKNTLFICNTVYQLLLALWIKYSLLHNEKADLMISDHISGGKALFEKLKSMSLFDDVYFVETHEYCYHFKGETKKIWKFDYFRKFPKLRLNSFIHLNKSYHTIYLANLNRFAKLLYNVLCHQQFIKPEVYLFEDGLSTYSLLFKGYFDAAKKTKAYGFRGKLDQWFYKEEYLQDAIKSVLVFNPNLMQWDAPNIQKLNPINKNVAVFLNLVNEVFSYKDAASEYDSKFIFMEESYFASGKNIHDVELVEKIAEIVGKENIMVKIHPRNKVNRFRELGYKTNTNTAIPWEVICMNMNHLTEKRLITITSSSVINPIMNFGIPIKAYSLYNIVSSMDNEIENIIDGKLWQVAKKAYEQYADSIKICASLDEIQ